MASLADYLHDFARYAKDKAPKLERELAEIDIRKREIEHELEAARSALHRASSFIARSGLSIYCPYCWIMDGKQSEIHTMPSVKPRVELYRCRECGSDYELDE